VVDDLGQPAGQGHARGLLALATLERADPRPQGARAAGGLGGGQDQHPPEETVAFAGNVPGPDVIGAGPDAGGQADVAGEMLGAGEADDVAQLEDEDDGDERTNAGDCGQTLDSGIGPPQRATSSWSSR
jgi:hypothetical protein